MKTSRRKLRATSGLTAYIADAGPVEGHRCPTLRQPCPTAVPLATPLVGGWRTAPVRRRQS